MRTVAKGVERRRWGETGPGVEAHRDGHRVGACHQESADGEGVERQGAKTMANDASIAGASTGGGTRRIGCLGKPGPSSAPDAFRSSSR